MRWYRSLYWRIALGVVAFLAAMLVVQAVLFVWAMAQSGRSLQGQTPGRFAATIAFDLSGVLERDPSTDLAQYVRDQYAQYEHPFFAMMSDGRLITSGSSSFPDPLLRLARARLDRGDIGRGLRDEALPRPDAAAPPPDGAPRPNRPRFGQGFGGPGFRGERGPSPIVVAGHLAGVVVVPPQAPFSFVLSRYGPMLAVVAIAVLGVGTVLTSVMIFGPARRRLRALETAAKELGAGDLSARAPDRGGDEIAAVASAFNAMAKDLGERANALAVSDRLRRQLLADVSHELNTPVTAMRGYIETLSMPELSLDEQTRARYLAIIGDETARLERLIGDLLELARLEGGGGGLRMEPVEIAKLFARVTARHERACADANIVLRTTIGPGADTVIGDRDRLEQALQNLAANAIRYAPPRTAVQLSAQVSGPSIVLAVEDDGAGISAEHVPHVFDRFYKADSSRSFDHAQAAGGDSSASGGSGLGLSIVKAIIERHGGTISVRSRPGRTIFEMTLPSRQA